MIEIESDMEIGIEVRIGEIDVGKVIEVIGIVIKVIFFFVFILIFILVELEIFWIGIFE